MAMINGTKRLLLIGASALAILAAAADANAVTFAIPGGYDYIVPFSGLYAIKVFGAQGGGNLIGAGSGGSGR
jgi:hypothetical protein